MNIYHRLMLVTLPFASVQICAAAEPTAPLEPAYAYHGAEPADLPAPESRQPAAAASSSLLPLLGDEARKRGYVLPLPFGVSINYMDMRQNINVDSINFTGLSLDGRNIDCGKDPVCKHAVNNIFAIGFGEAGGILAADLAREHAVTIWDCKLNGPEREAMLSKARDSRVQVGNSLAQALEGATLVFSTVTAGEALKVAQQAAALLQPGQYFLDLNSVAPETKRQAAEHFLPGAYIDVAVMAPVPPARLQTPLLIGGPQAEAIAPRLQRLGLNARYGASTVGQVSAIKMCRSVMIKGLEALTTECLFAAREYGVEEEVLSSLHHSFPSLGWTGAFPDYLISRVAEHGIRRSEEMEEVVKTLRDVGSAGIMSEAIAKSQRQLPEQMAARSLSYRQLTPFDWKTLVARLK